MIDYSDYQHFITQVPIEEVGAWYDNKIIEPQADQYLEQLRGEVDYQF